MELTNILIIVSAIAFILLLWIIVGVRHLRNLVDDVKAQWEVLDEYIRRRHNLIPNLVETVRVYDDKQEKLFDQLIEERMMAAKEYFPGAKKIEYEHALTSTINRVVDLSKFSKPLTADTNFLEIRKDIYETADKIEENTEKYNNMVRYYNNHRNLFFIRPLSFLFRFKVMDIFEIEK